MFTKHFGKVVSPGDTITCKYDGFEATATLYRDDDTRAPDKRQDGFWPSLDPQSAGYIGARSKRTLARRAAKAQEIMDSWLRDEWHYYGVVVTVERKGVCLTDKAAHALWGLEGNYPGSDNHYFQTVANELLPEALQAARAKLQELCST